MLLATLSKIILQYRLQVQNVCILCKKLKPVKRTEKDSDFVRGRMERVCPREHLQCVAARSMSGCQMITGLGFAEWTAVKCGLQNQHKSLQAAH